MFVFGKKFGLSRDAWNRINCPTIVKIWITEGIYLPFDGNNPVLEMYWKNGKYRLMTDFRLLNRHITTPLFQNEGIHTVSKLVCSGDYLVKTDLKDRFFHIPVYPPHWTYLGFEFQGQWYVWCVGINLD